MQCSMFSYEKYNQDFHFLDSNHEEESLISPSPPGNILSTKVTLLSMETIRAANGNRICLCEFSAQLEPGIQPGIHYQLNNAEFFWSKINGVIILG